MLRALVIVPNEQMKDFGSLLAVARAEARKREHSQENPLIRTISFIPELSVYVAVYEASENPNAPTQKKVTA
jgi:hypothetical protein